MEVFLFFSNPWQHWQLQFDGEKWCMIVLICINFTMVGLVQIYMFIGLLWNAYLYFVNFLIFPDCLSYLLAIDLYNNTVMY